MLEETVLVDAPNEANPREILSEMNNFATNIAQKLDLSGSHALIKFAFAHKSELSG